MMYDVSKIMIFAMVSNFHKIMSTWPPACWNANKDNHNKDNNNQDNPHNQDN